MPREFLIFTSTGEVLQDSIAATFSNAPQLPPGTSVIIDPPVAPDTVRTNVQDAQGNTVSSNIYDGVQVRNALPAEVNSFYAPRDAAKFISHKQKLKAQFRDRDNGYNLRAVTITLVQLMNEIVADRTEPITKQDVLTKLDEVVDGMAAD